MRTPDGGPSSYHFPTNFYLKRANICVFLDVARAVDLPNHQDYRWLRKSCPLGSSPAAPAILFLRFLFLPNLAQTLKSVYEQFTKRISQRFAQQADPK
jgi:hypothetical protein